MKRISKFIILVLLIIVNISVFVGCKDKITNGTSDNTIEKTTPLNNILKVEKPVIYLYPIVEEKISVNLDFEGELTCTYPEYQDGWNVIAKPDGTLFNTHDNKEYSYLFWEGKSKKYNWNLSKGFVVEGKNTKDFLQEKLHEMGLTPKEYNDFIVYWLPEMQHNKFNLITFAGEEYEKIAGLKISPKPDSTLRVFMLFKSLDKPIDVEEQKIKPFERKGFTVVEWGGAELK